MMVDRVHVLRLCSFLLNAFSQDQRGLAGGTLIYCRGIVCDIASLARVP